MSHTDERIVSERLAEAFHHFMLYTPPERLNRCLRTLLIEYIGHNNLTLLFELLDRAAKETRGWYEADDDDNEIQLHGGLKEGAKGHRENTRSI
jgi:hypothetical protein